MDTNNIYYYEISQSNRLVKSTNTFTRYSEKVMILLVASLGLIGSFYIFSTNSNVGNSPQMENLSFLPVTDFDQQAEETAKPKFKKFIKIKGDKKVGSKLTFTFLKDRLEKRYVLDIDGKNRIIITADEFEFTFTKPGKHTLELKTLERGLVEEVASKTIEIK